MSFSNWTAELQEVLENVNFEKMADDNDLKDIIEFLKEIRKPNKDNNNVQSNFLCDKFKFSSLSQSINGNHWFIVIKNSDLLIIYNKLSESRISYFSFSN